MAISKVVVVDGNNLIVQIDRGVAGRGITDVAPVEINNQLYLVFTFTDGTTDTVGPVGTIQYLGQSPIVINGATISLSTVPVTLGGTGQITANAGFNALAPSQTSNAGKYLKTDGTNTSWDLLDISTGDITGTLPVTNGGTGATTASGARTNLAAAASATTISAGTGLSGGGDLTANRTLSIANTGVTAAAYGSASKTLTATVNAQGQLTVLADTNIAITNTQVSGLGTASTLNAGVALGVATLDAGGTVPLSQIPASIQGGVSYQGTWNATTNTPTLTSSVGSKGYYYVVSVAGSTNLNGITSWNIGDWAIFNGTAWEKIDNTDAVTSVNGYTGTVVLTNTDITGFGTMSTQNANNVSITGGSVTGITDLAIADGGTGQSTAAAAITALTGTQVAGRYLRSDGTNAALSAIQAADVPTLNQNTTGTAAGLSATLAIASGGTGQTTANTAFNALAPSQTGNSGKYLTTDGSNTSWATNPLGTVTSVGVSGGTTGLTTSGGPVTTSGTITLAGTLATTNGGTGLTSFTANGVVYASSTSALATGSALTFDGTNLAASGYIGAGSYLNVSANAGYINFSGVGTASAPAGLSYGLFLNSGVGLVNFSAASQAFWANSAEQMRLTSTGLGIGTSSPAAKLDVSYADTAYNPGIRVTNTSNSSASQAKVYAVNNAGDYLSLGRNSVALGGQSSIFSTGAYPLQFFTNSTLQATLDSSGNLGLGVTPSAWFSTRKVFQMGSFSNLASFVGSSGFELRCNAFLNTSAQEIYLNSEPATLYGTSGGAHRWYNAPSGTAGNAITFTQAMTLDASGNLVLGATSAAYRLDVRSGSTANTAGFSSTNTTAYTPTAYNGDKARIFIQGGAATGATLGIEFTAGGSNENYFGVVQEAGGSGAFVWQGYNGSAYAERARIDSSGNLLVGSTTANGKLYVSGAAANGVTARFEGSSNASNPLTQFITSDTTGNPYFTIYYTDSTSNRGSIQYNRGTGLMLYNTTSDYRAKDIYGPVADSGVLIDSVPVYMGKMKGATQERPMFIAHETPDYAHTGEKDAVDADGNPVYQQMDASALVPVMWAELQDLRKRLAAAGI